MRVALVIVALGCSGCQQLFGLEEPSTPDANSADAPPAPCGLRDPGFKDPAVWQTSGGARVLPYAPGFADLGVGKVENVEGTFSQAACIAAPNPGEGLALLAAVAVNQIGGGEGLSARASVGSQARTLASWSSEFASMTMCLGDLAYDTQQTVTFTGFDVQNGSQVAFDSVGIASVPPATCPVAGTVRSGDFEIADAWTPRELIEGGALARRAHLHPTTVCNTSDIHGVASIPSGMTAPAIMFKVNGKLGTNSKFYVDAVADSTYQRLLEQSSLPTQPQLHVACLPSAMRGQVIDLSFGMFQSAPATCPSPIEAYIDDVMILSVPSCPP